MNRKRIGWLTASLLVASAVTVQAQVQGRYVRLVKPGQGDSAVINIAEVEVFSGVKNIALTGKATQSSTAWGGVASRAIDGNTDGDYNKNNVTHTQEGERNPWWEVDLGDMKPIDKVVVWNRADKWSYRLSKAHIFVLDDKRVIRWSGQIDKADITNPFKVKPSTDNPMVGKHIDTFSQPQEQPPQPPATATQPIAENPKAETLGEAEEKLAETCAEFKAIWDEYKANTEKINAEFQPRADTLQQQYLKSLETLKTTVQGRGDLDKAKAVATEIERFTETKTLPPTPDDKAITEIKSLQTNAIRPFASLERDKLARMNTLTQRYGQALERLQTELVKAGKLDDATAVREARECARRTLTPPTQGSPRR